LTYLEVCSRNINVVIELSSHWSKNVTKINSHILLLFFLMKEDPIKYWYHLNNFINRSGLTKPDEVGTLQMQIKKKMMWRNDTFFVETSHYETGLVPRLSLKIACTYLCTIIQTCTKDNIRYSICPSYKIWCIFKTSPKAKCPPRRCNQEDICLMRIWRAVNRDLHVSSQIKFKII
jgi:hypothetical protein